MPPLDDLALFAQLVALAERANRPDLVEELRRRGLADECKPFFVDTPDKTAGEHPQGNAPAANENPPKTEPHESENVDGQALRITPTEAGTTITLCSTATELPPGLSIN
jgi:hypothetical protein